MRRYSFILVLLLVIVPLSIGAYDTRLLSLNNPTLSQTAAVPSTLLPNLLFPTDEFGLGVSAVPDSLDIWKLPQQLANKALFPSNAVILDYTGPAVTDGNAGLVLAPGKLPLVIGVFCRRPDQNGWMIGTPRLDLPGLGLDFFADGSAPATMQVGTGPSAPSNIADLILALRLGNLAFGAGAGFSYDQALNSTTSTAGTANSDITEKASSSVITLRGGANLALTILFPLSIDLGTILMLSNYSTTYVSGAAAPVPNENDSITARNMALSVSGRIAAALSSALQVFVLGDFASLPQNYSAADNAVALDSVTIRVDPASFTSFGAGTGFNWTPAAGVLVNALVSGVLGQATWTREAPGAVSRPADSFNWTTLRCLIDGEFPLLKWLIVRGGLGGSLSFITDTRNVTTGGLQIANTYTVFSPSAAAGLGLLLTEKVALDLALNLANFMTSNLFQTLVLQASLKADL